jgi:hypothetical protein
MISLQPATLGNRGLVPMEGRDFAVLGSTQVESEAHTAFYPHCSGSISTVLKEPAAVLFPLPSDAAVSAFNDTGDS